MSGANNRKVHEWLQRGKYPSLRGCRRKAIQRKLMGSPPGEVIPRVTKMKQETCQYIAMKAILQITRGVLLSKCVVNSKVG